MSYLLCCPLLDPQIAGTGELPPDTINQDGEKKIIAKMIKQAMISLQKMAEF